MKPAYLVKLEQLEKIHKEIGEIILNLKPKEYPIDGFFLADSNKYAINSGVYRQPMFGEYYLSGASPRAYLCKSRTGYSDNFYIAEIKTR